MDDLLYRALKFLEGVGAGTNTDACVFSAEEAATCWQAQSFAGNGAIEGIDHIQIPEAPQGMLLLKTSRGLLEFMRAGIHDQESFRTRWIEANLSFEQGPAPVRQENIHGMERMGHHLASGWRILDGAWSYKSDGEYGTTEGFQSNALMEDTMLTVEENRFKRYFSRPIFQGLTCLTTSMTLPSR
jgi:hypothetical protein